MGNLKGSEGKLEGARKTGVKGHKERERERERERMS